MEREKERERERERERYGENLRAIYKAESSLKWSIGPCPRSSTVISPNDAVQ